jgi:hypothetical protein
MRVPAGSSTRSMQWRPDLLLNAGLRLAICVKFSSRFSRQTEIVTAAADHQAERCFGREVCASSSFHWGCFVCPVVVLTPIGRVRVGALLDRAATVLGTASSREPAAADSRLATGLGRKRSKDWGHASASDGTAVGIRSALVGDCQLTRETLCLSRPEVVSEVVKPPVGPTRIRDIHRAGELA